MGSESNPTHTSPRFKFDDCGTLEILRRTLESAGYTQAALAQTAFRNPRGGQVNLEVLARRTAEQTPFNILVRLFFMGQETPFDAAEKAIAPMVLNQLVALGLLQAGASGFRSTAMLVPHDDLYVASDFPAEFTGIPEATDFVLGVGRASTTLADLTVRRSGETVLDLGAGSGFQALLASRHASQVIATDLNPRALSFARLSAHLNGITKIEIRQGSFYAPVEDCQFNLIVANPPFVISPESRYLYRDGAIPGDAVSERVIRGAPARLCEDGYAVVLCNWHHDETDWSARLRTWVQSSGCDAWLLRLTTDDPLSYAAVWSSAARGNDKAKYGQDLDDWLQYYRTEGIKFISSGAVILRRRKHHSTWVRVDSVLGSRVFGSCSAQIQRVFAAQDLIESIHDGRQLLDYVFQLAPEHQLEHILKSEDRDWAVKESILKLNPGVPFTCEIDRLVSIVLAGCDGKQKLGDLLAQIASSLKVDREKLELVSVSAMRKLIETGFLSFAEPPQ